MATVLLSALAATITLVVVRQSVLVTRTESVKTDYSRAYSAALDVQTEFERQLRDDPRFYLTQVFPYERPRSCQSPPDSPTPVFYSAESKNLSPEFPWVLPPLDPRNPAGQDTPDGNWGLWPSDRDATGVGQWPAECGTSWSYLEPGEPLAGFDPQPVRAEITPPSPDDPNVTLRVLAHVGQAETGVVAVYRPETVAALTAYAGSDLHLDQLYRKDTTDAGTAPLQVSGSVYADGRVWLPTGDVDLGAAQIFAEDGFVGSVGASQARLFTGRSDERSTAARSVFDLRTSVAQPLTMESLRSSAGRVAALACPGSGADPVNYDGGHPREGYASELCLTAGGRVVDVDDHVSTLPDDVRAWLLMPTGSTVRVYYAARDPQVGGDCRIRCDVTELARADLDAGTHPGGPLTTSRLWQPVGVFGVPSTGLVGTDATTYVSHCDGFTRTGPAAVRDLVDVDNKPVTAKVSDGAAAPVPGPQCAPEPDSSEAPGGGVVIAQSMTVIAGTPRNPADIVVGGPIRSAGPQSTGRLGLVATGTVRVPYFARPPGGDLPVKAAVVAYGFGAGRNAPGVVSVPRQLPPPNLDVLDPNYGDTLLVSGSLAAVNLNAGVAGFRRVQVSADETLKAAPPPHFPTFSDRFTRTSTSRLSSQSVCGGSASHATSCVGIW